MVGHFHGLKLVMQLVIFQKLKAVVNIQKRSIFGELILTHIYVIMSLSLLTYTENHWSISESLIPYLSLVQVTYSTLLCGIASIV